MARYIKETIIEAANRSSIGVVEISVVVVGMLFILTV